MSDWLVTLRALLAPRRLAAIALVAGLGLFEQARHGGGALGLAVSAAFVLAVVAILPHAFLRLAPLGARRGPVGVVLYTGLAAAIVGALVIALPRALAMPPTLLTDDAAPVMLFGLAWVAGFGLGRDVDLEASLAREKAAARSLAAAAERARLFAMRRHLDPHFVFNVLNAIAESCVDDPPTAERAMVELGGLLRETQAALALPAWPLARELALVRRLVALYALRDPAKAKVREAVDPACLEVEVPPLVVMMVVENALKHGPWAGHAGEIVLEVSKRGTHVRLVVENAGEFRGEREGGEGIPLLRALLSAAYGEGARLELQGAAGKTRATVELPTLPTGGARPGPA